MARWVVGAAGALLWLPAEVMLLAAVLSGENSNGERGWQDATAPGACVHTRVHCLPAPRATAAWESILASAAAVQCCAFGLLLFALTAVQGLIMWKRPRTAR